MSADHLQFLKNKFILDLEDAEEEHSGENEIPLLARFLQIRDALKAKDITASTPIRLKNCLYNAISALEECVVLSEKREPRKKKDGPMHGYTLAEHWILCKTRKLLVQVKRKLTAPADAIIPGMTDMAGSSSSTSLPLIPRPNPENFNAFEFSDFNEQLKTILDRLRKTGEGFQEIGIVGIGGSGKTALAQLVFTQSDFQYDARYFQSDERYFRDYRIWICLFRKLSGNVRFKKMIKDMLKQCKAVGDYEDFDEEEQSEEAAAVDDEDYDGVEVEELLENLGKALKGKRYLMVLDGMAASSSSTSLQVIPRPNSRNFYPWHFRGFDEQITTILDRLENTGDGFQEIGIVGIGGSGKTTLAQLVFTKIDGYLRDNRIWICLFPKLSGDVDFKEMIKDMLKQCGAASREVEVEELLENLGKALKGKRYLMVLDGIWDINIYWYFKLKDKLKSLTGDGNGDGHVIITSRLPHKARMMVGPRNLYHIQPPLNSMEDMWDFREILMRLKRYKLKLKDEVMEQCDGLPLAMHTLAPVIVDQITGDGDLFWDTSNVMRLVLVNLEDDAILGNELLLSWRTISSLIEEWVIDVSKLLLRDVFNRVHRYISRHGSVIIIVLSGDAKANQLMQVIMQVVRNLKRDSNPPTLLLLPLASKANISFSLGWENQPPGTLPKHMLEFQRELRSKPKKDIDSWGIVMKMKSIPEGFPTLEENSQPMEADKEFHVIFWNYFIIGLDIEDLSQKNDGCCGSCSLTSWPRNIVLPISIKTKDEQGEWKEISIPHSTRSIICVNLPCFPDRPNVKKKYRNFKDPFVDDGLLEVICFKDAWHGNDFLPSKDRGECLVQVETIRFELYNSAVNNIHMSIDGNRWKHPLPIEDDNKVIEIYHSGKTKVFVNSNSRCEFKSPDE